MDYKLRNLTEEVEKRIGYELMPIAKYKEIKNRISKEMIKENIKQIKQAVE